MFQRGPSAIVISFRIDSREHHGQAPNGMLQSWRLAWPVPAQAGWKQSARRSRCHDHTCARYVSPLLNDVGSTNAVSSGVLRCSLRCAQSAPLVSQQGYFCEELWKKQCCTRTHTQAHTASSGAASACVGSTSAPPSGGPGESRACGRRGGGAAAGPPALRGPRAAGACAPRIGRRVGRRAACPDWGSVWYELSHMATRR